MFASSRCNSVKNHNETLYVNFFIVIRIQYAMIKITKVIKNNPVRVRVAWLSINLTASFIQTNNDNT